MQNYLNIIVLVQFLPFIGLEPDKSGEVAQRFFAREVKR